MQYGLVGSGNIQAVRVLGGDVSQTTLSGLEPARTYSIEVAAMNDAGVGLYSDSKVQLTLGK